MLHIIMRGWGGVLEHHIGIRFNAQPRGRAVLCIRYSVVELNQLKLLIPLNRGPSMSSKYLAVKLILGNQIG